MPPKSRAVRTETSKDYQKMVMQLLLQMRGDLSSAHLSRKLGYSYNQIKRWETGAKQLRWDELCDYCQALQIPISQILFELFHYENADPHAFLKSLYTIPFPRHSIDELARRLHRHRSAIRRYLNGEVYPELEFVLALFDLESKRLLPQFLSALLRENVQDSPDVQLNNENPCLAAILAWLQTEPYLSLENHDSTFIALHTGCSVSDVDALLNKMMAAQIISRQDNGKFEVLRESVRPQKVALDRQDKNVQFWLNRAALQSLQLHTPSQVSGCRVVPISQETLRKINETLLRVDTEIRMILDQDEGPYEDVQVILLKTFSTQGLR